MMPGNKAGVIRCTTDDSYADNFAHQWHIFRLTQYDSYTGLPLTFNRLWNNTKWKPRELYGARVLEAGCGAGRFTEILLDAGAEVVAFDISSAVDIAWEQNRKKGPLTCYQADIYDLPMPDESFDYVLCYGVLQHTPRPEEALRILYQKLRANGRMSLDWYLRTDKLAPWNQPKYFWRRWTAKMDPNRLHAIVARYIPFILPLDTALRYVPVIGPKLLALLRIPCWNYIRSGLSRAQRREWAIMDTFDALGARYDDPRTLEEVERLVGELNPTSVEVFYGGNGVVANLTR